MSKLVRTMLAAAIGAVVLSASTGALAHDRERHDGYRGYGKGHYKHHHDRHRHEVIRQRVVIHEPPPVVYERRAYYGPPAIVIGFDIPPLVVPLR